MLCFFHDSDKPFPTFVSSTSGGDAAVNNSKTVTLPTGIVAGDYIVLSLGFYNDLGITGNVPSGYTSLVVNTGTRIQFRVVYKVAAGTESGTNVTVTASANHFLGWTAYVIRGASSIEASSNASATSGAPDSPNMSPSWGADSTLFLATMQAYGLTQSQSTPSGYSNFIQGAGKSGGVDWARVATAWNTSSSSSENPPAFGASINTGVTNPQWLANTIAFKPV